MRRSDILTDIVTVTLLPSDNHIKLMTKYFHHWHNTWKPFTSEIWEKTKLKTEQNQVMNVSLNVECLPVPISYIFVVLVTIYKLTGPIVSHPVDRFTWESHDIIHYVVTHTLTSHQYSTPPAFRTTWTEWYMSVPWICHGCLYQNVHVK